MNLRPVHSASSALRLQASCPGKDVCSCFTHQSQGDTRLPRDSTYAGNFPAFLVLSRCSETIASARSSASFSRWLRSPEPVTFIAHLRFESALHRAARAALSLRRLRCCLHLPFARPHHLYFLKDIPNSQNQKKSQFSRPFIQTARPRQVIRSEPIGGGDQYLFF